MRTFFATALASAAIIGVSASPGLSLSLMTPESVSDIEDFSVTAIVKNTGNETLKLLKDPRGVLSSARTHTFSVANEKGSPQFTGMFVKYSPDAIVKKNNAASFTILEPGQSFEITHSLAGVYNFTNTGAGTSSVQCLRVRRRFGQPCYDRGRDQSKKVGVSGKLVSTRGLPKVEARSLGKRAYVGCNSNQQSLIATAAKSANEYVKEASSYLSGVNSGTNRYTTWFGAYTTERASTVSSHFSSIGTDATSVTFDCSTCTVDAFAYVYADDSTRVYLCRSFWEAPNTGTDSRAGAIVHELSHFTVNGGTEDYAYGHNLAKNLAKSNPAQAVMNADSHEYFAENTPALS
ncbi:peptidyl-Lys metalloendopeptidase [Rhizoctonia solani]|uniref:Peptidyl-Lys metalloendopeptidase n=1 Tax=Rhizoctonia solani TaxID=456999 RepID=A0A8H7M7U1_9AGAM|nr:peptidyl-Lys metalloendopeptidase [Rhizoctonia solani]